jgi:hypothetical protein
VPARSIGRPLDGPRRPGGGPPWPWLARAPAENSCPDLVAGNSEGLSPFTLWPDQAIREPHGCRTGTGSRSPSLEFSNINRCGRLWAASRPRPARLCAAPDPSPARAGRSGQSAPRHEEGSCQRQKDCQGERAGRSIMRDRLRCRAAQCRSGWERAAQVLSESVAVMLRPLPMAEVTLRRRQWRALAPGRSGRRKAAKCRRALAIGTTGER